MATIPRKDLSFVRKPESSTRRQRISATAENKVLTYGPNSYFKGRTVLDNGEYNGPSFKEMLRYLNANPIRGVAATIAGSWLWVDCVVAYTEKSVIVESRPRIDREKIIFSSKCRSLPLDCLADSSAFLEAVAGSKYPVLFENIATAAEKRARIWVPTPEERAENPVRIASISFSRDTLTLGLAGDGYARNGYMLGYTRKNS